MARWYFMAKGLPPLLDPLLGPFLRRRFFRFSDRTTWEVLSSLTRNPELIGVLATQYGDYGLPPRQGSFAIHAMIAKHYREGAAYPIGGSGRFAQTIIPVIEKGGGKVLVSAAVERILTEGGKVRGVRLENGDEILAPLVISDAGVVNTYGRLLDPGDRTNTKFIDSSVNSHGQLSLRMQGSPMKTGVKSDLLFLEKGLSYRLAT